VSTDVTDPTTNDTGPGFTQRLTRSLTTVNWREGAITVAAIVLALVVGAIVMVASDPDVASQWAYLFSAPALPLQASWAKVSSAYAALFIGALGSPAALAETTARSAALIAAGLGVGLAFRAGLFNIGAQGQAIMGALTAAWIGFAWEGPPVVHLIVAILGGLIGGMVWGGIVGVLKAKAGAHEVIVTIMMNYIAAGLLAWLLTTTWFQRPGRADPISPEVHPTAVLPSFGLTRFHLGFILAIVAALFVWWLLERSVLGFQIRAVGANPHAAKTAGMSADRTIIFTMALAGALAGLAGIMSTLSPAASGTPVPLTNGIVGTVGFDAITVALLGRSHPIGIIFAGLLFGAMNAGGLSMQSMAQTPNTLILLLQALIVLFVAAPKLVSTLLPFLKARKARTAAGGDA
jgi:simple sugar transport system permease protein